MIYANYPEHLQEMGGEVRGAGYYYLWWCSECSWVFGWGHEHFFDLRNQNND